MSDGEHQSDGRLVGGRYRLAERIGSGGMGTVWRARDELVGREVAVKQPRLPGDPQDEARRRAAHRLYREARAAARVDHRSAVTIHDVVEEDGVPWIVMELIQGESLHEMLRRGPVPPAEAARIALAVLGALRAAHAVGIVHRDVKPANVLLGRQGRVVLTDFGIAHVQGEESLTVSGEFVGSLEFVAPERMSGRGAGPASDLWSLGVLLYAAVEGSSPFRRGTPESTLAAVLASDPPEPRRAGVLGPLLARLLAKDPERRPGSEEVAVELEAVTVPQEGSERFGFGDDIGTARLRGMPESAPGPQDDVAEGDDAARLPKSGLTPASGTTPASGSTRDLGSAPVSGSTRDLGSAPVSGSTRDLGSAPVSGSTRDLGSAPVSGAAPVSSPAPVSGVVPASGPAPVSGAAPASSPPPASNPGPAPGSVLVAETAELPLVPPRHPLHPLHPLRRPAPALLLGVLVIGGALLATSSFRADPDDTRAARRTTPDSPARSAEPRGTAWTAHREKDLAAVLSLPGDYEVTAREDGGADDRSHAVVYDLDDTVQVRLTRWEKAPGPPMSRAREAHTGWDRYDGDARTQYTRTTFDGREAVLADTTYNMAKDPSRVMQLVILADHGGMYELRVDMPKGTPDEKKGTSVFRGARDRLVIEAGQGASTP
ncbi:protein kinase domain-containing protein [Streptomyces sp. NPDC002309]